MGIKDMEPKGDFSPIVSQQPATETERDAALDSSGNTNKSPLPASGRRPIGNASKLIGFGIAAAAAVSGCLPSWLVEDGGKSSPSSMPSGIVKPSPTGGMPSASTPLEVTPIPSPSAPVETVAPTLSATPSKGPEVSLNPTQESENQAVIEKTTAWTLLKDNNGIPTAKLWTLSGFKQPLNITSGDAQHIDSASWIPHFSTLDEGVMIINDANGAAHGAMPIFQVDGAGNHYFFFANIGPLSRDNMAGGFTVNPTREIITNGTSHDLTETQTVAALNSLKGDVILVSILACNFPPDGTSSNPLDGEVFKSEDVAKQIADFSVEATKKGVDYHTLLAKYPLAAAIINNVPNTIDPTALPYPTEFVAASLTK